MWWSLEFLLVCAAYSRRTVFDGVIDTSADGAAGQKRGTRPFSAISGVLKGAVIARTAPF
jgi:hypothetical protein